MSLEPVRVNQEEVRVKEEIYGQQICETHIKKDCEDYRNGLQHKLRIKEERKEYIEPQWSGDIDSSLKCVVKEENGLLELYAGHKVEADLVLGPEGPQPPDSAFNQPTVHTSPQLDRSVSPKQFTNQDAGHSDTNSSSLDNSPICIKPHICEVCTKQFKRKNNLDKHRNTHRHREYSHACELCNKRFPSKYQLVLHKRTHKGEKHYACEICKRQFELKQSLTTHLLSHNKEKPYCCETCKKRFKCKHHLATHLKAHIREKPFACEECARRFTTENQLAQHEKLHISQCVTLPKPFSCIVCSQEFTHYSALCEHRKTHAGEKCYRCDMCDVKFEDINLLVTHKRIHSKEKRYSCKVCDKQFISPATLIIHANIHIKDKPYKCDLCTKQFNQKGDLDSHRLYHARKPIDNLSCNWGYVVKRSIINLVAEEDEAGN